MTDLEFNKWLISDDAVPCLLLEVTVRVGAVDTPLYLSSAGYTTRAGDTPANTPYLPLIMGGMKLTEKLSLETASLSYGDIEINNAAGELDSWLGHIWVNRPFKIFFGDVRWVRSDFRLVLAGMVADIDSRSRTRLNIKIRDMLERLNTPVSDVELGGTTQSKDKLIPLVFGEVHNMEPILEDPAHHTYRAHLGAIQRVIEVRDNGAPVTVVADTIEGRFMLSGTPAGTITASIQGDKQPDWNLTVASIIKRLVTGYGKEALRFTAAEIDTANFDAFDAAHPQPVGICMTSKVNVLAACQDLAATVGARLTPSREGKLQLLKLQFPGTGTPVAIEPRHMLQQNLVIAERSEVKAAVKIGYCKNWVVQEGLETGILEEHKKRFAEEWDHRTVRYSSVAIAYGLDMEPEQKDTLFLRRREAEPEAWRLLDIVSVPRTTYRFEGLAEMLLLRLGQAVTIQHPRFGLETGRAGVVVGLVPDYINRRCTVEVMV